MRAYEIQFYQIQKNLSYTEYGVDERIVATIAHGDPVADEKYHVDVFVSEKTNKIDFNVPRETIMDDCKGKKIEKIEQKVKV